MAAATLFWERAREKSVYRPSELKGHLKIIYFKTSTHRQGNWGLETSSNLPRSICSFTAEPITESRFLDSQSKMFLHRSGVPAAFLGTVIWRWFGQGQSKEWSVSSNSSASSASSFSNNHVGFSSQRVNKHELGFKVKETIVRWETENPYRPS